MVTDSGTALGPTGENVRQDILVLINETGLQRGARIGAERDLAADLGVSRTSVRAALAVLERSGHVNRIGGRGGGVFVGSTKVERDLSRIVNVPQLLRDQGFAAGSRIVSLAVRAAGPDVAVALAIDPEDLIVDLVRIRFADGTPISLEQAMLPAYLVDGLPERDLAGSLYELLDREYAIRPAEATERIEVVLASPQEASILEVATGQPLLAVRRTTRDTQGRIFEHSTDLFRADRTVMVVRTKGTPDSETPRLSGRHLEIVEASA